MPLSDADIDRIFARSTIPVNSSDPKQPTQQWSTEHVLNWLVRTLNAQNAQMAAMQRLLAVLVARVGPTDSAAIKALFEAVYQGEDDTHYLPSITDVTNIIRRELADQQPPVAAPEAQV